MLESKIGAIAVVLLGAMSIVPLAAQQPSPSEPDTMSGTTPNARVPDETVARTGAALRRVAEIHNVYAPKVEAAPTPDERTRLSSQATDAARKAISDQGLTVEQYNEVVVAAQDNTELEERLLEAANGD